MQIKLKVTLQTSNKVYPKDAIFIGPESAIPHDIMREVKAGTPTVEVLEWDPAPPESELGEPIQADEPKDPPEKETEVPNVDEAPLAVTEKEKDTDQEAKAEPKQPRAKAVSKPKLKKAKK